MAEGDPPMAQVAIYDPHRCQEGTMPITFCLGVSRPVHEPA